MDVQPAHMQPPEAGASPSQSSTPAAQDAVHCAPSPLARWQALLSAAATALQAPEGAAGPEQSRLPQAQHRKGAARQGSPSLAARHASMKQAHASRRSSSAAGLAVAVAKAADAAQQQQQQQHKEEAAACSRQQPKPMPASPAYSSSNALPALPVCTPTPSCGPGAATTPATSTVTWVGAAAATQGSPCKLPASAAAKHPAGTNVLSHRTDDAVQQQQQHDVHSVHSATNTVFQGCAGSLLLRLLRQEAAQRAQRSAQATSLLRQRAQHHRAAVLARARAQEAARLSLAAAACGFNPRWAHGAGAPASPFAAVSAQQLGLALLPPAVQPPADVACQVAAVRCFLARF